MDGQSPAMLFTRPYELHDAPAAGAAAREYGRTGRAPQGDRFPAGERR